MIFFFVKLFDDEEEVRKFRGGTITVERLSHLRKYDSDEGTLFMHPTSLVIGPHNLTPDLVGPVTAKLNWMDNLHILSLYAGNFSDETITDTDEFRRRLQVSDEFLRTKPMAVVITNTKEFIERIEAATTSKNFGLYRGLVKYFDPAVPNNEMFKNIDRRLPGLQALLFRKMEYQFRSEYRFIFITGSIGDDDVDLQIGDISDISIIVEAEKLNSLMTIRFPGEKEARSLASVDG